MPAAKTEPRVDSTLSKGLLILENLARAKNGKGVTQLSRELELTKSNTFRLLQTLTTLGYVKHGADKSYSATLKTWQVGRHLVENLNLREFAAPEMSILSRETGETIYLAVPEGMSVIYIYKVESQKAIRSWNPIGGSAPIHCVGTGKAILSANYDRMREILPKTFEQFTENTITTLGDLDDDMTTTRERGYAFDTGEFRDRILSFGAAIVLPDGNAIAALGISLPDINMTDDGPERIGKLVQQAAHSVSHKLSRL
ncbi:MAG: helix-turn-helix domain-containing protein [Boseongicola sp.]|nr:MAG: helix-turn-helix domain-containing protein [Boseongicola sp.]